MDLIQPQAGEVIQDPALGTAGFLYLADRSIKDRTDDEAEIRLHAGILRTPTATERQRTATDSHEQWKPVISSLICHSRRPRPFGAASR